MATTRNMWSLPLPRQCLRISKGSIRRPNTGRFYSTTPPHSNPNVPPKTKIFAPKLRLAIGVPFVALIIYSMVRLDLVDDSLHQADSYRRTTNPHRRRDPHSPTAMPWPSANPESHLPRR